MIPFGRGGGGGIHLPYRLIETIYFSRFPYPNCEGRDFHTDLDYSCKEQWISVEN